MRDFLSNCNTRWIFSMFNIRSYGHFRPFGSTIWLTIFGRPVFIYWAVWFGPNGPTSYSYVHS